MWDQAHTSKNEFTLWCSRINVCVVVCDAVSVVNYTVLSVWITKTLSSLAQKRTVPKYARETAGGGLWAPVLTRAVSDLSICHQYQKDNKWGRGERESERAVWRQCVDYALLKHAAGKNELAVWFVVCDVIVVLRFCALIKHSYQPDMKMICRCFTLWHSPRAMAVRVPKYIMDKV